MDYLFLGMVASRNFSSLKASTNIGQRECLNITQNPKHAYFVKKQKGKQQYFFHLYHLCFPKNGYVLSPFIFAGGYSFKFAKERLCSLFARGTLHFKVDLDLI